MLSIKDFYLWSSMFFPCFLSFNTWFRSFWSISSIIAYQSKLTVSRPVVPGVSRVPWQISYSISNRKGRSCPLHYYWIFRPSYGPCQYLPDCQFPFQRIYYYGNNKPSRKEIGKTHLSAVPALSPSLASWSLYKLLKESEKRAKREIGCYWHQKYSRLI